jgi:DNA-binding XRE family transcriptional regulator
MPRELMAAKKRHPLARWRALQGTAWFGGMLQGKEADQGWTQQRLADEVGVHQTTIARIEAGHPPTLEHALKIAAALGVHAENIWGDPHHVEDALERSERAATDLTFGVDQIKRGHERGRALMTEFEALVRDIDRRRAAIAELEAQIR